MQEPVLPPCAEWIEKLAALHPDDLSASEWEAFHNHVRHCAACAAFLTAYREMDNLLLVALTPQRPLRLPAVLLRQRVAVQGIEGYFKQERSMRDLQGSQFGNYKLARLLGKGGHAEVWLGTHLWLNTPVAVKVLREPSTDIADFKREARLIQQLAHPNIVRILDFGIERNIDIPYLIMEYAPYGTLRQRHPKGQSISLPTIIPYVEQVSDALQYAHNNQVIHRDVKPENMLLGIQNQVLLSDFGIATGTPSIQYPNRQGIAGTIGYMAPEQITGTPVRQSDQYSLAVVVYEWLTGSLPPIRQTNDLAAKLPSSTLGEQLATISSDVERIVLKALASKPEDRFETVRAFADALKQAMLTQSGLTPPRILHHAVGTTLCTYEEHTDWIYAVVWLPNGQRIASAGNDKTIQSWDASNGSYVVKYREHSQRVAGLASSPDGRYISSASHDKTVQTREVATGAFICKFVGHKGPVNSVSWSPDSRRLASGGNDRTVRIWDIATCGQTAVYQGHTGQVNAVSWSPNGEKVASASHDKTVQIWNADTGERHVLYKKHTGWVMALAWSPDGRLVASAGNDNTLQVWSAITGSQALEPIKHTKPITSVAWSPDGRRLAFGSLQRVEVWDLSTRSHSFTYHDHTSWVRTVAWSPDGTKIASAGDDKKVQVWSSV